MACCNPLKCAMMQTVVLACIATAAATANYFGATEQRSFIDAYLKASSGSKTTAAPTNATSSPTGSDPGTNDPATGNGQANGTVPEEGAATSQADPNKPFGVDNLPEMITVEQAVVLYNLPYEDPNAPLVFFFDAREVDHYLKGHIPAAYNVTPQSFFDNTLPAEIDEWPKDSVIVVYCDGGNCDASHLVETRLKQQKQFTRVCVIEAGYPGWQELGLPTEQGRRPAN